MKKKKNKLMAMALSLFLIMSVLGPSTFAATPTDVMDDNLEPLSIFCNHTYGTCIFDDYYYYKALSNTTCAKYASSYTQCLRCRLFLSDAYERLVSTGNHNLVLLDGGHNGARHSYTEYCTLCWLTNPLNILCPGNPCIAPYNIPVEIE